MKLAAVSVVLASLVLSSAVEARIACNSRAEVVKVLAEQFGEVPVASGITQSGQLMEVFASAQGTWTLILSLPRGQSCMIANGEDLDVGSPPAGPTTLKRGS